MVPCKNISFTLIALFAVTLANATPVLIEASFDVDTTYLGHVSGSFSKTLEVSASGAEHFDDVSLDSFSLSPSAFGSTTFDVNQVGADFWFNDGVFLGLLIGGFEDGVNGLTWAPSGPVKPSDLMLLMAPSFMSFNYIIDGQTEEFIIDAALVSYELKLSTPAVPDHFPAFFMLLPILALAAFRPKRLLS